MLLPEIKRWGDLKMKKLALLITSVLLILAISVASAVEFDLSQWFNRDLLKSGENENNGSSQEYNWDLLKQPWADQNNGSSGNTVQSETENDHTIKVGNIVTFGHYPQTASGTDNTPIDWLVLDVQDGKALLISRYALDCVRYNREYEDTTWSRCSLSTWLTWTFLQTAFTSSEQDVILTTAVDNSKSQGNSRYSTDGGSNT